MQSTTQEYTVVGVHHAEGQTAPASEPIGGETPPEILERFEGRTFSLQELEQRGVRIAGGKAIYTANGMDWSLQLWPEIE